MHFDKAAFTRTSILIVAVSFLLYNIYQATTTTIFLSHFQLVVIYLPHFIKSSHPNLQLALFLFQEIAGSIGSYIRLIGAIFALDCAVLFFKKDLKYFERFGKVLLFESLYFLLLLPAALNHLVGSIISSSAFLNFYTGLSCLIQAALIFPPLFILSRKLRKPQDFTLILKCAGISAILYVFAFWVRHGLLWVYALLPLETRPTGLVGIIGSANSLLTLLVAAIVTCVVVLISMNKKKLDFMLAGIAIILVGSYFVIYDLISIWSPIYHDFLPLTDFWMITLPILGIAIYYSAKNDKKET